MDIYIYGRGVKGLEAFFYLRDCGLNVEYIIDNDQEKQGRVLPGLRCINYKEFLKIGNSTSKIIISNKRSKEIVAKLHKDGFENIELWIECKKRYNHNLAILKDIELSKRYLNLVKRFDMDNAIEEVPYIYSLIGDMKFRNELGEENAGY